MKKATLKNFAVSTGKHTGAGVNFVKFLRTLFHLCWSLFLVRLQCRRFPVRIVEIFEKTYFEEHLRTAASLSQPIRYWFHLYKNEPYKEHFECSFPICHSYRGSYY